MDRASYFIKDLALFGSFPTQECVDELEKEGVRHFVNLTYSDETKITPYITKYNYISFPIRDGGVPKDWRKFSCFLIKVAHIIKNLNKSELLYLHCKGGHGRSGVVVACLLCYIYGLTPKEALGITTKSHSNRSIMREKWRKLGSPQTYHQKNFVYKFFNPLKFYKAYMHGHTAGFSNFTTYSVNIEGFGHFPTAEAAFQAYKNPDDKEYVKTQIESKSPLLSRNLGRKTLLRTDWIEVRNKILYKIVKLKFDQNLDIRENLLNTGLRPIVQYTCDPSNQQNILGKILMKIRYEYYSAM